MIQHDRQGGAMRSMRTMLRRSLLQIILGMAAPLVLLIVLLAVLTLRYDAVIADTSRAAVLSGTLEQELPDEIWQVVSGRIPFAQGVQQKLLSGVREQLSYMQARATGEEERYINAALRAAETTQVYVDQLGRQIASGAAVSRNENLYREIRSVAQLAATMIDRYVEAEIVRMGQLNASIQKAMLITALLLAVLIGFILRAAMRASRDVEGSIRAPILRLEEMAARIARGDLSARVPPAQTQELSLLTRDLNMMAEQIGRLLEERIEQEQHAQKAELRALQAQITPHFVYNTLETVVWLAEEGRNREVVDITMAFTDFLRIVLSQGQDMITVAREEQHVYSYLMIQSVRYGSIMQYEIDIDSSLAKCRMLKLMLQPLVENAIYHGIKVRRGRGMIRVYGRRMGDSMLFQVEDNGLGMTAERLAQVCRSLHGPPSDPHAKGGYGLRNVQQRLQLYYGASLDIESEYNKGTRVSFCVPCNSLETEGGQS